MLQMIVCSNPLAWSLVVSVLSLMLGAFIGAKWESRPISDLEKRIELHNRDIDEHEEGL